MLSNPSDRRTEDTNKFTFGLRKTPVQEPPGMKGEMNDRSGLTTTTINLFVINNAAINQKHFFFPLVA